VFKATEQITKYTQKLFGDNEKICPQNEGKSISEHLKLKFSRGSMPPEACPLEHAPGSLPPGACPPEVTRPLGVLSSTL